MYVKKSIAFLLTAFCLFTALASAQVVTSKKKAVEKGLYKKPEQTEISNDVKSILSAYSEEVSNKKSTTPPTTNKPVQIASNTSKSANKTAVKSKKAHLIKNTDDADIIIEEAENNYVVLQMINNAMSFIGTRYMGGGTTRAGMDCSGMVTAVMNLFDLKLPRSSAEMAKYGVRINKEEIQKGDLIFFRTNGKKVINHVGLVVEVNDEEIKFVHSSTSKGVIVSSTKEAYYGRSFVQANRIM